MAPPFRFVRLEPAQPFGEPEYRLCLEPYEGPAQWITFTSRELQELVDSATDLLPIHTPPPYVPKLDSLLAPVPGCVRCDGCGRVCILCDRPPHEPGAEGCTCTHVDTCLTCDGDGAA